MAKQPIIWAFLGPHFGDNMQVQLLSEVVGNELGSAPDFKQLSIKKTIIPNVIRKGGISMLTAADRAKIEPPWPDLIIFAGKRAVSIAKWVREQSGWKTKLVSIGRPRAPLSWFDLVVTTPQYGLPNLENVLEIPLPVVGNQNNKPANDKWLAKWSDFPRPWIGVLVGGGRLPLKMNSSVVEALANHVNSATQSGTWLVSASPRTGKKTAANLKNQLEGKGCFYEFDGGDETHRAILENAESFIVTGDSAMMIAEAVATKKPVEIVPLERLKGLPKWSGKSGMGRLMAERGIVSPPRDMSAIGQTDLNNVDGLDQAVRRIVQLLN